MNVGGLCSCCEEYGTTWLSSRISGGVSSGHLRWLLVDSNRELAD